MFLTFNVYHVILIEIKFIIKTTYKERKPQSQKNGHKPFKSFFLIKKNEIKEDDIFIARKSTEAYQMDTVY